MLSASSDIVRRRPMSYPFVLPSLCLPPYYDISRNCDISNNYIHWHAGTDSCNGDPIGGAGDFRSRVRIGRRKIRGGYGEDAEKRTTDGPTFMTNFPERHMAHISPA